MFSFFHTPVTPPSLSDFSPFHTHNNTRWPHHQTSQLSTLCSGRFLEGWHQKLTEHFGNDAIALVREDAQGELDRLPLHIDKHARYPLAWLLRLVEIVADRWMDGDLHDFQQLAFEALQNSDSHRASLLRGALRAMPLTLILRRATGLYQRAYDQGAMRMLQHKRAATLQFEGSAHHDHPTWQALQALGLDTLLKLTCGKRFSIASQHPAPGAFHLYLDWR